MRMKEYNYKSFRLRMESIDTGYRVVLNNRVYHFSKSFDEANDLFDLYVTKIEQEKKR